MLKKYKQKFLIASLAGFLMFYFLFWTLLTLYAVATGPRTIWNIPISIVFTTIDGLCQFPMALLVGFPFFLLGLTICNRLTSRSYLSVVYHALLAVPLSGLVLASAEWGAWHSAGLA